MSDVTSERSSKQIEGQIDEQTRELLGSVYRTESGRILATLIRLLGDFDLAEEAMHEAFAAALSVWPRSGVPGNPRNLTSLTRCSILAEIRTNSMRLVDA